MNKHCMIVMIGFILSVVLTKGLAQESQEGLKPTGREFHEYTLHTTEVEGSVLARHVWGAEKEAKALSMTFSYSSNQYSLDRSDGSAHFNLKIENDYGMSGIYGMNKLSDIRLQLPPYQPMANGLKHKEDFHEVSYNDGKLFLQRRDEVMYLDNYPDMTYEVSFHEAVIEIAPDFKTVKSIVFTKRVYEADKDFKVSNKTPLSVHTASSKGGEMQVESLIETVSSVENQ